LEKGSGDKRMYQVCKIKVNYAFINKRRKGGGKFQIRTR
jgi:hypothetical protein